VEHVKSTVGGVGVSTKLSDENMPRDYWVSELCPSSHVPNEHNVSETGSVSVVRWKEGEARIQVGSSEIANLHHRTTTQYPEPDPTCIYEGYSESNLPWGVKKQAKREQHLLYTQNKYILKLLLNVVTACTEALVVSGNKFMYACVKDVCRHWAQPRFDTFHQLLIIVEPILRKTCDSLAYLW
jgi:hypothetical protein